MMLITAFTLAAALQQPATRPPQQPPSTTARPSAVLASPASTIPKTPYDSTVGALTDIGTKVAEVRSTYELYRRAAFNDPNGAVLERAALYKSSSRALAAAVQQGERQICRSCLPANVQPAVNQYRAGLPALRTMAEQAATRIDRLRARGDESAVAAAMRGDVRAEGDRLVNGLRPYEARVTDVRRVMGWEQQQVNTPTPRQGN